MAYQGEVHCILRLIAKDLMDPCHLAREQMASFQENAFHLSGLESFSFPCNQGCTTRVLTMTGLISPFSPAFITM